MYNAKYRQFTCRPPIAKTPKPESCGRGGDVTPCASYGWGVGKQKLVHV